MISHTWQPRLQLGLSWKAQFPLGKEATHIPFPKLILFLAVSSWSFPFVNLETNQPGLSLLELTPQSSVCMQFPLL